jgi:hypothetical protein
VLFHERMNRKYISIQPIVSGEQQPQAEQGK